jgi:hypothetical protein
MVPNWACGLEFCLYRWMKALDYILRPAAPENLIFHQKYASDKFLLLVCFIIPRSIPDVGR